MSVYIETPADVAMTVFLESRDIATVSAESANRMSPPEKRILAARSSKRARVVTDEQAVQALAVLAQHQNQSRSK